MLLTIIDNLFPFLFIFLIVLPFFVIKKLRRSTNPSCVAMKSAPFGCLTSILLGSLLFIIFGGIDSSDSLVVSGLVIISGLVAIMITTGYFNKKSLDAKNESERLSSDKNRAKSIILGAFLFFVFGLSSVFSGAVFSIWVRPFLVRQCHLDYYSPVDIPIPSSAHSDIHLAMTEYRIGFIPGNESSFNLIVEDKDGNKTRYPDFVMNCGSNWKVAVYYIPRQSPLECDWVQFLNEGGITAYFNLATLQLDDECPKELKNAPRQLIGVFERGKFDPNAKAPEVK